jgi:hypothetical protein
MRRVKVLQTSVDEIWDNYEPNNLGGKESCLSVKVTGGLNDISCEIKLAFVCEQEIRFD